MIQISDDLPAAPVIRELVHCLAASGAWFNKQSCIAATDYGAGVFATEHFSDMRSIMRVPIELMPRISDFSIDIDRYQFRSAEVVGNPTSAQINIMGMMLEIYNCSSSLTSWERESPYFSLNLFPHVLKHLIFNVSESSENSEIKSNKLLADTFLNSRKLNRRNKEVLAHKKPTSGGEMFLMPMIDIFNHDIRTSGYQFSESPGDGNLRVFSRPDPVSKELFVKYNDMDAVASYIKYGFIDNSAPFVYSTPTDLSYRGYDIKIGRSIALAKNVPTAFTDLSRYMPNLAKQDNIVLISKLVIPGAHAPNALRRVLALILSGLDIPKEKLPIEIKCLEKYIIDENFSYWNRMMDLIASVPENHQIHQLTDKVITHLETYKQSVMIRDV